MRASAQAARGADCAACIACASECYPFTPTDRVAPVSEADAASGIVTGHNPTGSVSFTDGGNPISGCKGVALTGTGDTRSAICATSSLSAGTHSIIANYSGDAANDVSASAPLSQVINAQT